MKDNRLGRYFLYGLGEIFLVVVGILIALQIDTWNEARKDQALTIDYLKGIKSDIAQDIELINSIVLNESKSISIITSIEDVFNIEEIHQPIRYPELFQKANPDDFKFLFYRGISFRAINGTFNSLIADGKTGLIKNKELLSRLSNVYNEQHTRLNSIYDTLKELEKMVVWEYSYEKKHWQYDDLVAAKDQKIFLDLSNFTEMKMAYASWLINLRRDLSTINVTLDAEIQGLETQ